MQKYTEISENTTLRESREQLLNNDKTAMSNSSAATAPSVPLVGQSWFNTDTKEFQIWDGEAWIATGITKAATQSAMGLMSAEDKMRLDSMDYKANNYTHPDSGVTAGTYTSVTVDQQGHVTEGKNVDSIAKLTTARNITLSGDVTGSASFDGSQDITITTTTIAGGESPIAYDRNELWKASGQTAIVSPSWLKVAINDTCYVVKESTTISLATASNWDSSTYATASNRAGKDFYIYACQGDDGIKFLLSANSTVPSGYTAATSRKIGGFHCLCVAVGTISGHTLTGYAAGAVLPASVWDLQHRPVSEPEGMVYVDGLDLWVDIYLCSWTGTTSAKTLKTISKYGATTGDGTSTEKFHPLKWEQTMGEQKKRLPYVREFRTFSVGSNQGTNIYGSADVTTTGGHKDTASRRMISNYGIEDCCGFLWQWCADVGSASTSASWGAGYSNDRADIAGQIYGTEYRPIVGGHWGNGSVCGSRAAAWNHGSLNLSAYCGGRGASEPLSRKA